MDNLEHAAEALWSDLSAAALQPIELSEIVDLFAVVTRGAESPEVASRLGDAHAVVDLAGSVVAGRRTLSPERSALVVVVAAYLCSPSLSERWFGYSVEVSETALIRARALAEFGTDLGGDLG
ncbi:hypothetical protein B1759_16645 [Rubrivirga sp. SAORIC476]|uniref:hypothetical protein n=1 Tax=Rubrivirga sp. SAORIC476 TaxID=1961794 RepID=UPI000BA99392|nr:hypothetical protein [Rubrivirga sp. SAORIC476]PAP74806.1 hypothetical protein B1759_16645 [Rubrivirga sp. SAORIC476]